LHRSLAPLIGSWKAAVGNDIVIKSDAFAHPRFAKRVLAPEELARYLTHPQPQSYLHRAWAAKEASYKYLRQKNFNLCFSPSRLVFHEEKMAVTGEGEVIALSFLQRDEYLYCSTYHPQKSAEHAIATIAQCLKAEASEPTRSELPLSQSAAVRRLARTMIAKLCALPCDEINIGKNRWKVPYACYRNEILPLNMSLTHDGEYVAVALMPW
jgi:phosphopantetheine--protein transferase-like protein